MREPESLYGAMASSIHRFQPEDHLRIAQRLHGSHVFPFIRAVCAPEDEVSRSILAKGILSRLNTPELKQISEDVFTIITREEAHAMLARIHRYVFVCVHVYCC